MESGKVVENRYKTLIRENLERFYAGKAADKASCLGAEKSGDFFSFRAFGEACVLEPGRILLSDRSERGPKGVVITLYALNAVSLPLKREPFKAFRDLPNSMPYHGAFGAKSENVLVPLVTRIRNAETKIRAAFQGGDAPEALGGDFSFVLYPLPKIALCYLFYLPDEDFPASVTCLFSSNALSFMPIDGLADTAEYTSRRLIALAR